MLNPKQFALLSSRTQVSLYFVIQDDCEWSKPIVVAVFINPTDAHVFVESANDPILSVHQVDCPVGVWNKVESAWANQDNQTKGN